MLTLLALAAVVTLDTQSARPPHDFKECLVGLEPKRLQVMESHGGYHIVADHDVGKSALIDITPNDQGGSHVVYTDVRPIRVMIGSIFKHTQQCVTPAP